MLCFIYLSNSYVLFLSKKLGNVCMYIEKFSKITYLNNAGKGPGRAMLKTKYNKILPNMHMYHKHRAPGNSIKDNV